jgi:hypothetical protein
MEMDHERTDQNHFEHRDRRWRIGPVYCEGSAAIACRGNVCWHVQDRYEYPPEARIIVHPDDWRWGRREHYVWREHEGRGYWRGGRWMQW